MLTDRERMIALVNNLEQWDWKLYPTYPVDEEYAKMLSKVLKKELGLSGEKSNENN